MIATGTAENYLQKGDVFRLSRKQGSQAYYDSARIVIEEQVRSTPNDEYLHLFLGKAYAGLSRTEDAIREGKLAVELLPVSEDAFVGPDFVAGLAEIYAIVGEYDLAIDNLEYLLSIPSWISASYIATWPEYAPLRDHPRFKALVEN
jgi:tetratricopeptide (TPR) repeat protein